MLLHAKRYWPEYITTILWLYALKMAEFYSNKFDIDEDGVSQEERFSNTHLAQNLTEHHT
eukprot:7185078-Ditylum_brightwellii.AAC.1